MPQAPNLLWRPGDNVKMQGTGAYLRDPEVYKTIETVVDTLSKDPRAISLDISGSKS